MRPQKTITCSFCGERSKVIKAQYDKRFKDFVYSTSHACPLLKTTNDNRQELNKLFN